MINLYWHFLIKITVCANLNFGVLIREQRFKLIIKFTMTNENITNIIN